MGPSVKFVSTNKGLISKKNGGRFFSGKITIQGGGSEGGLAKDHIFSEYVFLNPSLIYLGRKLYYDFE